MPMMAGFSRRVYDQLGDDVVRELIAWANEVDATLHSELREVNEINFIRFEAKLDQRIAELRTDVERRFVEIERRLGDQTRWLAAMWITIIAAAVALWFRR